MVHVFLIVQKTQSNCNDMVWQNNGKDVRFHSRFQGPAFSCVFISPHTEGFSRLFIWQGNGCFFNPAHKKGKENEAAPTFLGHVDTVMIRKTSAMATHCQKAPGRAGESRFVCYTWPGLSPWPRAPQYCGGNPLFSTGRALANLEHRSPIRSWCRKAAWSELDTDGWESAGKGKGHVGWKNWSGRDREPEMEFLLDALIGFPWVNSNAITVATLIVRFYEMLETCKLWCF